LTEASFQRGKLCIIQPAWFCIFRPANLCIFKPAATVKRAKIIALDTSKAIVLNPWSHAAGSAIVAADVQAAVNAVQNLW